MEDAYSLEIVGHQMIIELSTNLIDFGSQAIGRDTQAQKITFTNLSETTLKIDKLSIVGKASSFELTIYFIFINSGIWSYLFVLGNIVFILGVASDPVKSITQRVFLEQKNIQEIQKKCLEEIIGNESYESLSTHKKNQYDQAMEYYTTLQNVVMEMLIGSSTNLSKMEIMMAHKDFRKSAR